MTAPTTEPTPRGLHRIQVCAREFGELYDVSKRTVEVWNSQGKCPKPVRHTNGCVRWPVAELIAWSEAGCPDRETWERLRAKRVEGCDR